MLYKCIIFDFDGTLADTENQVFTIYNSLADKYKYKKITKEDLHKIKNSNFVEIMKLIDIPYTSLPKIVKEGQRYLKNSMGSIQPFQQDIKDVLVNLRSNIDVMGIITSNTSKNVKKFIANEDIDLFDFVESSPLLGKEMKINSVCKKHKLNKEEVLYIGDETRDIDACKHAQVKCAAVTWGYNYPETLIKHNPDYLIKNLNDILDIL